MYITENHGDQIIMQKKTKRNQYFDISLKAVCDLHY